MFTCNMTASKLTYSHNYSLTHDRMIPTAFVSVPLAFRNAVKQRYGTYENRRNPNAINFNHSAHHIQIQIIVDDDDDP